MKLPPPATAVPFFRTLLGLGLLTGLAALLLYARSLYFPVLQQDDFQILENSWTWQRTADSLWKPHNEHSMPLGRLLTYVMVQAAGTTSALQRVVWMGPVALLAGMVLVHLFVSREVGSPVAGLLAAALFGVTSVYQQGVYWFSAAFSVLTLDTLLLALLACQRWRQTGRALYLDLAVLWCALAPAWFASGVLAGPLCCLYLLFRDRPEGDQKEPLIPPSFSLLPLLGTGLFLAVSLPRTAATIMHLEHYNGQTALEKFNPLVGMAYTARSIVDNLLLGVVGIRQVEVPVPLVAVILLILTVLGGMWWWRARHPRLLLLGLGMILSSYLLVYSARASWGYEGMMATTTWCRYHLVPHLGLVFIVIGGWAGHDRLERWVPVTATALTRSQVRTIALVIGLCFLIQLPRGLLGTFPRDSRQITVLRTIESVDERCRRHHISADLAIKVLPPLDLLDWGSQGNGWVLLRGSTDPVPMSPEQARQLLLEVDRAGP